VQTSGSTLDGVPGLPAAAAAQPELHSTTYFYHLGTSRASLSKALHESEARNAGIWRARARVPVPDRGVVSRVSTESVRRDAKDGAQVPRRGLPALMDKSIELLCVKLMHLKSVLKSTELHLM
jgi:hypothetical protein